MPSVASPCGIYLAPEVTLSIRKPELRPAGILAERGRENRIASTDVGCATVYMYDWCVHSVVHFPQKTVELSLPSNDD